MLKVFKEPTRRGAGMVPWGFELDPEDHTRIIPNLDLLEILEQGIQYRLAGYSARECAAWISSRSGRDIDHRGLNRRITKEQRLYREHQRALPPLPNPQAA